MILIQEIAEWGSKREGEPVEAVNRELEQFLNILPRRGWLNRGDILIILTAVMHTNVMHARNSMDVTLLKEKGSALKLKSLLQCCMKVNIFH